MNLLTYEIQMTSASGIVSYSGLVGRLNSAGWCRRKATTSRASPLRSQLALHYLQFVPHAKYVRDAIGFDVSQVAIPLTVHCAHQPHISVLDDDVNGRNNLETV